jgi:D-aminoacyl-tRNA deacylase
MRALVQRVTQATVSVEHEVVGKIGPGLAVLLGVRTADTADAADWLANKVAALRVFEDEAGMMNLSLTETGGAALVVPQFTLYGDARRGRRPSFSKAAAPEVAEPLFTRFCERLRAQGVSVATGRFRTHMLVEIHNDGPVTLMLDTDISRRGNVRE